MRLNLAPRPAGPVYTCPSETSARVSPLKKHLAHAAAIFVLLAGSFLLAAQQPQPIISANAAAERIPNLGRLVTELKHYHDCACKCGCYAKDLDQQANRAIAFLRRRAAHRRPGEKLALILDIDETTLSNYQEMAKADFAYDAKTFDAWVNSSQAPAIPGTLRLYREARRLGVAVFFLTGRPGSERAATERNLRAQGFTGWRQLIMRSPAQASETALRYKSADRARIAAEGYTIILNVGDQWSDLQGKPMAEFSVKYPDPFYCIP